MRCRAVTSAALLAVLAGGGAAYAGDYTPETTTPRPACTPLQTQNLLGGVQVCPIDADVDPVVTLPVVVDLQ